MHPAKGGRVFSKADPPALKLVILTRVRYQSLLPILLTILGGYRSHTLAEAHKTFSSSMGTQTSARPIAQNQSTLP